MGSLFSSVSWRWHKDLVRHPQALRTPFDDAIEAAMWRVVSLLGFAILAAAREAKRQARAMGRKVER